MIRKFISWYLKRICSTYYKESNCCSKCVFKCNDGTCSILKVRNGLKEKVEKYEES